MKRSYFSMELIIFLQKHVINVRIPLTLQKLSINYSLFLSLTSNILIFYQLKRHYQCAMSSLISPMTMCKSSDKNVYFLTIFRIMWLMITTRRWLRSASLASLRRSARRARWRGTALRSWLSGSHVWNTTCSRRVKTRTRRMPRSPQTSPAASCRSAQLHLSRGANIYSSAMLKT